ncbi:hypothetical protein O6H91_13G036100 [Diphasiastrum complanatum]|uniref:Uncharacterized protein n=1 Tax=Diphasiastrum complanatum TaxID=34168 RepID=A0ACC2BTR3_DIPCM|nr:hypothetical protein O6H91_13G036100 [Diphasiastrum complanatum]
MAKSARKSEIKVASKSLSYEKLLLGPLRTEAVDEKPATYPTASPKKNFTTLRSTNFRMGSTPRTEDVDDEPASCPDVSPRKRRTSFRSMNFKGGSTKFSLFACGSPDSTETTEPNDRMPFPRQSQFDSRAHSKAFSIKTQVKLAQQTSKMLVAVNVLGSTGPLRFVVDVDCVVSRVIELALRAYAKQGRLPSLGLDPSIVQLYCCNGDFQALDPLQRVGTLGTRQFFLHRRQPEELEQIAARNEQAASMTWKLWWNMKNTIACSA